MTAKRTGRATSNPASSAKELSSEMANRQAAALHGMTEAGQAYAKSFTEVNQEIANFLQTRLRHDVEFAESLARCRTLSEATNLQSEWLKQAADEYSREAQKLFALGSSLMQENLSSFEQATTPPKADTSEEAEPRSK